MKPVVMTPAPARRLANLALIPTLLFGVLGLLGVANGSYAGGIVFLLFVPGYVLLGTRVRRTRVDATDTALIIHNPFRSTEVAFSEIQKVGVDDMPGSGDRRAVYIRPRNDRDVFAWCTSCGPRSVTGGLAMMTATQQDAALERIRAAVDAAATSS